MDTVTHDGRTTAYVTRGPADAPAICYVHGSGGSHRVWTPQLAAPPDGYRAVGLDLSGHGDSDDVDVAAGVATLDAYVSDVRAVAEATDATVFVGNSLGGAVLLRGILDGALAPRGLVLAGTGAKLAVAESLRDWLANDYDRAVEFLHSPDRLFHDADETVLERSRAQMHEVGQAVTERDFRSCHTFDVRDRLDEIDVPTLAVCGASDTLTPPSYHEYLAERLPNADVQVLSDAAHLVMLDRPDAFTSAVTDFVADL
jgi:pimeloyl-ACP methyl ester carboxylesterase